MTIPLYLILLVGAIIYAFVFLFGVGLAGRWLRRRRLGHAPQDFCLRRQPGESLRRQIEERIFTLVIGGFAVALMPLGGFATVFTVVEPRSGELALWSGLLTAAVLVSGATYWIHREFCRLSDESLGYRGERAVAEALAPLAARGYHIFHDVPAQGAEAAFNLDHVVVGATGVMVIETKTRRKGRSQAGRKIHEVHADGEVLHWPWGDSRAEIRQAESEARWLDAWIRDTVGLDVQSRPIVAIPGWYVTERRVGRVRVQNPKTLPSAVHGRGEHRLTAEQVDALARLLDQRCRDRDA